MQLFHHLLHALLSFFGGHVLLGLFGLLTVEEAGVPLPIPGDMLVMFAGVRQRHSIGYDLSVILVAAAAVFVGSSLLYVVSRRGGQPLITRLGRYLHLNLSRLERIERWFRRHGALSIVIGRLIPGLRVPTTIMAGLSGVPYRVYAPTAAIAALLWASIYFWLGVAIHRGSRFFTGLVTGIPDTLSDALSLWILIGVGCLVIVGLGGTWHMRRRQRQRQQPATARQGDPLP